MLLLATPVTAQDAPAEAPLPDLSGLHVALDVGHNKSSLGAMSARGVGEFYFNQATARKIAEVLKSAGAKVTIINEEGDITSLWDRPRKALDAGAHAFISIHHDSVNDKYLSTWVHDGKTRDYSDKFRGYSVFASKKNWHKNDSRTLAKTIGVAMKEAGFTPTPHHNEPIQGENRPYIHEATGVYEFTDLIVTKAGRIPSALLECGVIIHRDEELEVQKPEYQERIGRAVAHALATARQKKAFKDMGLPPR